MRTKGLIYFAALALALGLIVAGCGGGGDDSSGDGSGASSSSGEQLTQDEFVDKANAICVTGRDKLTKIQTDLQTKVQGDPSQAQSAIEDSLSQLVPVVREIVNQIADLNAPEDLQAKLEEFKTKTNEALDEVEDDPSKAATGTNAFADLNDLANELGLKDCGAAGG